MKKYLRVDNWDIIEDGFHPERNRASESIFSIGNGSMGQRANFEEKYSGSNLQGHYLAGVYYPDKTRVGWWKIGYPEYFAKVINAPSWTGIQVKVNGQELDLARCRVESFRRVLHMREGYLERSFRAVLPDGKTVDVSAIRFLSIREPEAGAIRYSVSPVNFSGIMEILSDVNGDVKNEDANYHEKFWKPADKRIDRKEACLLMKTKKLDFQVATAASALIFLNGKPLEQSPELIQQEQYLAHSFQIEVPGGAQLTICKFAAQPTSLNHPAGKLMDVASGVLDRCLHKGFDQMLAEQAEAWAEKWETSDIVIEGDPEAQQGIRFNIFQLNQTYTGADERLNIGPKGFTGEKYGGSTYWDTEAFCFPFYLSTADQHVARNLLVYRYKHLEKAIENASRLGFSQGAALYPMVTMNGEECHNEWEITFEEIHRNGAIAYAIFNYIRYTGDKQYLEDYGLEVLIAIARFWEQRVSFSEPKQKYVILGVTGPNEYENNVNNNWYTNTIAAWCMGYAMESLEYVRSKAPGKYNALKKRIAFDEEKETSRWKTIVGDLYFPYDPERNIFLQQEGYLDKEQRLASDLAPSDRPLNQKWSWDRILRSCFIKQADVLQGLYFLEDRYDTETLRRNFDFYEPRTVHESSLSAAVHSVMAARVGYGEKAYELYLRTARLDLDDYNHEVHEGLHITSMAGTWLAVVQGFGGMRTVDGTVVFRPMIPGQWKKYSFHVRFRGSLLLISVSKEKVLIENTGETAVKVKIFEEEKILAGKNILVHPMP